MLDSMNIYINVSENSGTPKSSILIGFSIIFTILFGVPLFSETPIYIYILLTHRKLADFSSVQKLLRNADPKPAGNCDHGGGNPLGGGVVADAHITPCWNCCCCFFWRRQKWCHLRSNDRLYDLWKDEVEPTWYGKSPWFDYIDAFSDFCRCWPPLQLLAMRTKDGLPCNLPETLQKTRSAHIPLGIPMVQCM